MAEDIRWIQRLDNYQRALTHLQSAVELMAERELSQLEKQGVIQAFEFCWELAWKLLKDYLQWQGIADLAGARDATREAFRQGLIADGQVWMAMLQDRNRTAHTYNEATMLELLGAIRGAYASELTALADHMRALANEQS
ncbi:nucleotidyltransferase substrate binding protein [Wenzhouxiangella limi]|uniref:Nucleotidyltransferase n=1 Tax=Wenzhouxiangella limi TaxID=2707351 RepID=A0A845UX41_9GAMM|nr:nucleotidyltransferase substrate binding protein [Wenzhouxiangella limi]NDY95238.1 nucleotidyltransferase [Wenzhouxiangella limi]